MGKDRRDNIGLGDIDRRRFMEVFGGSALAVTLDATITKALAIPAHHRTGTIADVEHIVILMQENRPFDHHFGTLRGVRGYADPRAVDINLPLKSGGAVKSSVFLQPAGSNPAIAAFGVPPDSDDLGGPAGGVPVIPPFRVDPQEVGTTNNPSGQRSLGLTYLPGTNHNWDNTHFAWNQGQYDQWAAAKGPIAMNYFVRSDVPYHCALADAFTVLDGYYHSVMGPTNPNRMYMFAGGIGNIDGLTNGTDGAGAGPVTANGFSPNHKPWSFPTFPEVLLKAGVTFKVYQDLAGTTFAPDFGDPGHDAFVGNFGDNTLLYFAQYENAAHTSALFENVCTGTDLTATMPVASDPASAWKAWALSQFAPFKDDVENDRLPQVSWIAAPAGNSEHSNFPCDYGAWYISQVLDILVSNPEVFSKTVLIVNYDEADGSFDHVVPPSPPQTFPATPDIGASTVDYHLEIVTTTAPNGPIGLGSRVPAIVISPWTKGGFVNSQVFDHTSTIQFIEKRFGVFESNISPWRRAVCGDLTSVFNFEDPNDQRIKLPSTDSFLPSVGELSAAVKPPAFIPSPNGVFIGVPDQEKGVRPARALPYELDVNSLVQDSTVTLRFVNSGEQGAVFQVRSGNTTDPVRNYTVEAGKTLSGDFLVSGSYDLKVYGPNGFTRFFRGSVGKGAAVLNVDADFGDRDGGSIELSLRNGGKTNATVTVLDAYTGDRVTRSLRPGGHVEFDPSSERVGGWYDLIVTVAENKSFEYRLTGHIETRRDSISDPAMGGLVTLKA
jgi:phospholipase C